MNGRMIYFAEKNIHGGWAVYGEIGVHQYYGCTKKEALNMYASECKRTVIRCQKKDKDKQKC